MVPSSPKITQIGNLEYGDGTIVLQDSQTGSEIKIVTIYVKGENLSLDIIRELDQQYTCNDIPITEPFSAWKYVPEKDFYYRDLAPIFGSEGTGKYKIQISDKTVEFTVI